MAVVVMVFSAAARLVSIPRLMWLMKPLRTRRAATHPEAIQKELARLIDALLARDFFVFQPKCWKRAPVLYRFLALHGVETRVMFGLRKDEGGEIAGHAWLEAAGRPILETQSPSYSITYSFPPDARAETVSNLKRGTVRQG